MMAMALSVQWQKQTTYILHGTYLELHPEFGSGWYFVIDVRNPDRAVSGAFPLKEAKRSAMWHAKNYLKDGFVVA